MLNPTYQNIYRYKKREIVVFGHHASDHSNRIFSVSYVLGTSFCSGVMDAQRAVNAAERFIDSITVREKQPTEAT